MSENTGIKSNKMKNDMEELIKIPIVGNSWIQSLFFNRDNQNQYGFCNSAILRPGCASDRTSEIDQLINGFK